MVVQCNRAVQKRVQKRAGAGEREGTAPFPRSGTSDFTWLVLFLRYP